MNERTFTGHGLTYQFGLTVVLVVLVACGQQVPVGVQPSPPSGSVAGVTPTHSAPAGSVATPSAKTHDPAALVFERVAEVKGVELEQIIATRHGFIAGGCIVRSSQGEIFSPCERATILHSVDGREWNEATVQDSTNGSILALADTPLGLLAAGSSIANEPDRGGRPGLWQSSDGVRWSRIDVPGADRIRFDTIVQVDDGVVLFGQDWTDHAATTGSAWATRDLRAWTGTDGLPISRKVGGHPGVVSVGNECPDCPDAEILVRRSPDGVLWLLDEPSEELQGGQFSASAVFDGRAILAGPASVEEPGSAVWLDTPTGWRRNDLIDAGSTRPSAMTVDARGITLFASGDDDGPRAWSSGDGMEFVPRSLAGLPAGWITSGAVLDGRFVLLLEKSAMWFGSSP